MEVAYGLGKNLNNLQKNSARVTAPGVSTVTHATALYGVFY